MHFLVFQHAEVEHPGILRDFWTEAGGRIPGYQASLDTTIGPGGRERLAARTLALLSEYNATARVISTRFLDLVRRRQEGARPGA
jgi:hypothetical protein